MTNWRRIITLATLVLAVFGVGDRHSTGAQTRNRAGAQTQNNNDKAVWDVKVGIANAILVCTEYDVSRENLRQYEYSRPPGGSDLAIWGSRYQKLLSAATEARKRCTASKLTAGQRAFNFLTARKWSRDALTTVRQLYSGSQLWPLSTFDDLLESKDWTQFPINDTNLIIELPAHPVLNTSETNYIAYNYISPYLTFEIFVTPQPIESTSLSVRDKYDYLNGQYKIFFDITKDEYKPYLSPTRVKPLGDVPGIECGGDAPTNLYSFYRFYFIDNRIVTIHAYSTFGRHPFVDKAMNSIRVKPIPKLLPEKIPGKIHSRESKNTK